MKKIIRIITNRNFIFILSIVLGIVIRDVPKWTSHLTIPALAIVMTVSLTQISLRSITSIKSIIRPVLYSILFNYIIFAAFMLAIARFLIIDKELWIGFIVLAFAPPGVAIPPFTHIIGGNEKFSIISVVAGYIAALAIIPLAGLVFIGKNFIQPLKLILVFLELIIAPLIISQILIRFKLDKHIAKWRGTVVNYGLFIVIFVVIALNREIFFTDLKVLGFIILIASLTIFGLWFLISFSLKKLRFEEETRRSLILVGLIKNSGFAAATALELFGIRSSLPGAVFSVFIIIFLILVPLQFRSPATK